MSPRAFLPAFPWRQSALHMLITAALPNTLKFPSAFTLCKMPLTWGGDMHLQSQLLWSLEAGGSGVPGKTGPYTEALLAKQNQQKKYCLLWHFEVNSSTTVHNSQASGSVAYQLIPGLCFLLAILAHCGLSNLKQGR